MDSLTSNLAATHTFAWWRPPGRGGSSYIDDVILRDRDTDGNGTLDERRYYLQNQHHDVVALVNTSGSISERVNYDPYGSLIGTFTSSANRKGYAGYEYDAELGDTYHVRHRVYRSDLGVWTRRDPLLLRIDITNAYEYASTSPLRPQLVDECGPPDGLPTSWRNIPDWIWRRIPPRLRDIIRHFPQHRPFFTCCDWWRYERRQNRDWSDLPACPCTEDEVKQLPDWSPDHPFVPWYFHPPAKDCYRSPRSIGKPNNQCCYDEDGNLITEGTGAGTPDADGYRPYHWWEDVTPPFFLCRYSGRWNCYLEVRPPQNKNDCPQNIKSKPGVNYSEPCDCAWPT